jgi:hypothetical protein
VPRLSPAPLWTWVAAVTGYDLPGSCAKLRRTVSCSSLRSPEAETPVSRRCLRRLDSTRA